MMQLRFGEMWVSMPQAEALRVLGFDVERFVASVAVDMTIKAQPLVPLSWVER